MAVVFRSVPPRPVKGCSPPPPPSVARASVALGQILRERDLITQEQLTIAVDQQRSSNRRLGQVLLDLGYTTPDALLGALTIQLGVPAARLNDFTISAKAVHALPERIARKHNAVPLQRIGLLQEHHDDREFGRGTSCPGPTRVRSTRKRVSRSRKDSVRCCVRIPT
jgi:Type II secretion system (T2SS), protein E, N-terminal domain